MTQLPSAIPLAPSPDKTPLPYQELLAMAADLKEFQKIIVFSRKKSQANTVAWSPRVGIVVIGFTLTDKHAWIKWDDDPAGDKMTPFPDDEEMSGSDHLIYGHVFTPSTAEEASVSATVTTPPKNVKIIPQDILARLATAQPARNEGGEEPEDDDLGEIMERQRAARALEFDISTDSALELPSVYMDPKMWVQKCRSKRDAEKLMNVIIQTFRGKGRSKDENEDITRHLESVKQDLYHILQDPTKLADDAWMKLAKDKLWQLQQYANHRIYTKTTCDALNRSAKQRDQAEWITAITNTALHEAKLFDMRQSPFHLGGEQQDQRRNSKKDRLKGDHPKKTPHAPPGGKGKRVPPAPKASTPTPGAIDPADF